MQRLIACLSIRRKLTLVTMTTSAAALIVASVMFGVFDNVTSRQSAVKELTTMADVIGGNSAAALTFDDAQAGSEILSRLRVQPIIVRAAVYDAKGLVFTTYDRTQGWLPLACGAAGTSQTSNALVIVTRAIVLGREQIGTVCLESDLQEVTARHRAYAFIMLAAFAVALLAAFTLSATLQRVISAPILHLAQIARIVSTTQMYSSR